MQSAARVPTDLGPFTESTVATIPKSFLDLSAELRNRIYELISNHNITIRVLPWRSPRPVLTSRADDLESQSGSSSNFGTGKHQSQHGKLAPKSQRLAMLLVNRQIHDEASSIFYANMTLDMTGVLVDKLDLRLQYAMNMLGPKLKAIERIKIDSSIAHLFLWTPSTDVRAFESISKFTIPADLVSSIFAFRARLISLKSVEIIYDGLENYCVAAQTLVNLAGQRSRPILNGIFPKIDEITVRLWYSFESERFIRPKNEGWQRADTKEKLPIRAYGGWGYRKRPLHLLQPGTASFLVANALKIVGPVVEDGEKGQDETIGRAE